MASIKGEILVMSNNTSGSVIVVTQVCLLSQSCVHIHTGVERPHIFSMFMVLRVLLVIKDLGIDSII